MVRLASRTTVQLPARPMPGTLQVRICFRRARTKAACCRPVRPTRNMTGRPCLLRVKAMGTLVLVLR